MLDRLATAGDFQATWEGGLSLDRNDSGNWTSGFCGRGACVGSNHGVTARPLAAYRSVPVASITEATMHAVSADEAARLAVAEFFHALGLDQLPWSPVIASVFDFGWGAGPHQAMIGAHADGQIGPATVRAAATWMTVHGLEAAANFWPDRRGAFYRALVRRKPGKGAT